MRVAARRKVRITFVFFEREARASLAFARRGVTDVTLGRRVSLHSDDVDADGLGPPKQMEQSHEAAIVLGRRSFEQQCWRLPVRAHDEIDWARRKT
jgi:hypothetical protein